MALGSFKCHWYRHGSLHLFRASVRQSLLACRRISAELGKLYLEASGAY